MRSFDAKATVKRMSAVLALPWIDISESALSDEGGISSLGTCLQAQDLIQSEISAPNIRTYADQALYFIPSSKASVKCDICYDMVAGSTHFEVPVI